MTIGVNEISHNYPSDAQNNWIVNPQSCYRPPPDLNLKFLCGVSVNRTLTEDANVITGTEGGNFELFKSCCGGSNDSGSKGEQNWGNARDKIYRLEHNCGGVVCFTGNEGDASGWGECVKKKVDEFRRENGRETEEEDDDDLVSGWCETVWYENLEKSIAKTSSAAGGPGNTKGKGGGMGGMMVLGLVVGALVQGFL
ncbi:hypothetical protein QBC44DRAFT_360759 [Cladorrhinum sp. PSN332]|nr:hypothetical protein QBC44DRAFT_360759 [Cladorrhinum sp. PSN332]